MKKIPYAPALTRQAAVLEANRDAVRAAAAAFGDRVDPAGTVALLGIGASYYAGLSAVRELWKLGRRALAVDAGQLWHDPGLAPADAYLAISASGESLETVEAIRALRDAGATVAVAAVMAEDTRTLGSLADVSIPCGDPEDSVPATISYLATLQALGFLVGALGGTDLDTVASAWAQVPAAINRLLGDADGPAAAVAPEFADVAAVDFVGDADSIGSAAEGALLFREAPRIAGAWFDSRSYLHGPMEALDADRGLVLVGDLATDDGLQIIARQAEAIGCPCVVVGHRSEDAPHPRIDVPELGPGLIRATLEMVALQQLTAHLSARLDLTSGKFRYPQPQVKLNRTR